MEPRPVGGRASGCGRASAQVSQHTSLPLPAQARGGPGDNTSYAALCGVVRRLDAGLNCKSFSRLCCLFISVFSAEFE